MQQHPTRNSSEPLLKVEGLSTEFVTTEGVTRAVNGVSFDIHPGETVSLVGESGCGKSVTALSIMRLIQSPPGRITAGKVEFEGRDLLSLSEKEMQKVRGGQIGMIFQEPMTSLNPVLKIGRQIAEPLELHEKMSSHESRRRAVELLSMVGIPDAESRVDDYPHQLSGGQRQRVMIAIAMSCIPKLLIADEATTALDVTIQAQILELMKSLTERTGAALLIITHNLGVVARYADRVNVMYAGRIRESAPAVDAYHKTRHPYTAGLLHSVPRLDRTLGTRLDPIPGDIPDPSVRIEGCAFRPRCKFAIERCETDDPPLETVATDHNVACWEQERVALESQARSVHSAGDGDPGVLSQ
jgi:oligopeptide/dipeptide ABC transporter ATP-binding protein